MEGPSPARRSCGRLPHDSTIVRTSCRAVWRAVPTHPAWAIPMDPRTGSTSRMGTQSAKRMNRVTLGDRGTIPSGPPPRGPPPRGRARDDDTGRRPLPHVVGGGGVEVERLEDAKAILSYPGGVISHR